MLAIDLLKLLKVLSWQRSLADMSGFSSSQYQLPEIYVDIHYVILYSIYKMFNMMLTWYKSKAIYKLGLS